MAFIVQMQNTEGGWFDIDQGHATTLGQARRKAASRRAKNEKTPWLRRLRVRIVERTEREVE